MHLELSYGGNWRDDMKKPMKALAVALAMGALTIPLQSAQAWWGPWDDDDGYRGRHDGRGHVPCHGNSC